MYDFYATTDKISNIKSHKWLKVLQNLKPYLFLNSDSYVISRAALQCLSGSGQTAARHSTWLLCPVTGTIIIHNKLEPSDLSRGHQAGHLMTLRS